LLIDFISPLNDNSRVATIAATPFSKIPDYSLKQFSAPPKSLLEIATPSRDPHSSSLIRDPVSLPSSFALMSHPRVSVLSLQSQPFPDPLSLQSPPCANTVSLQSQPFPDPLSLQSPPCASPLSLQSQHYANQSIAPWPVAPSVHGDESLLIPDFSRDGSPTRISLSSQDRAARRVILGAKAGEDNPWPRARVSSANGASPRALPIDADDPQALKVSTSVPQKDSAPARPSLTLPRSVFRAAFPNSPFPPAALSPLAPSSTAGTFFSLAQCHFSPRAPFFSFARRAVTLPTLATLPGFAIAAWNRVRPTLRDGAKDKSERLKIPPKQDDG
jgi:hypothetical protein